jgi:DNA-binding NtrC family response regulator
VCRVAPTDATVLITGESGTGKELTARAIHDRSHRAGHPFIRVNCAAIPPSLIASELFGYERGAFTGAVQRHLGRFERADHGTIFLDEIGDIPAETQVALLRVLQEREFERVGGTHPVPIDVRVLAATNCDLRAAVAAGTFRADLYYRLHVFPIHMPALRERIDDIPSLVEHLIARCADKMGKKVRCLDDASLDRLIRYDWPGNIRELQNVLERAVILCEDEIARIEEEWFDSGEALPSSESGDLSSSLMSREKELIEAALQKCMGRVAGRNGAAGILGMPRTTLESRIKSLQIDKFRYKSGAECPVANS